MRIRTHSIVSHFYWTILLFSSIANAEESIFDPWHVEGNVSVHGAVYDNDGDLNQAPYFSESFHPYAEFNLNLRNQDTAYSRWSSYISGVFNSSDYRSRDTGLVIERVNLTREQGNSTIPYRIEAGDFLGFFSLRTLQSPLKGVQLELQPTSKSADRRYSLLILAGANQGDWHQFQAADNLNFGLSFRIDDLQFGRFGFNVLYNSREEQQSFGLPQRNQWLTSLVGEYPFEIGTHKLNVNGELAWFQGDHNGINSRRDGQNQSDFALYAELRGSSEKRLKYSLRAEQYGQHYRPANLRITPDWRSVKANLGWTFASKVRLDTRLQYYEDDFESDDSTANRVLGVNFTGPFLPAAFGKANGRLNTFIRQSENDSNSLNRLTRSINLQLRKPLTGEWNGTLGYRWQSVENRTSNNNKQIVQQLSFKASHSIKVSGFTGAIEPGIVFRNTTGRRARMETSPSLALNLNQDAHTIAVNFNGNSIRPMNSLGEDIVILQSALSYQYQHKEHTFGIDYERFFRDPEESENTDSYKIGLFWKWSFDKAARAAPAVALANVPNKGVTQKLRLDQLPPGMPLELALALLEQTNVAAYSQIGGALVFTVSLLDDIDQRQQLILQHKTGDILRSVLIINFEHLDGSDAGQIFAAVERALLDIYGRPTDFFERGEFDDNLARNISSGEFIRNYQWQLNQGILRFGIPRRNDGAIRMEIQFANDFGDIRDTRWSLERF